MSRCQYCKKLCHSEDLDVYYDIEDSEKISELQSMEFWTPKYMYLNNDERRNNRNEYGKLKVGDIIIHFIAIVKFSASL